MNETFFDLLIKRAGSHAKLAKILNIDRQKVSWWNLNTEIKKNLHGLEIMLDKDEDFEERVIYKGRVLTVTFKK